MIEWSQLDNDTAGCRACNAVLSMKIKLHDIRKIIDIRYNERIIIKYFIKSKYGPTFVHIRHMIIQSNLIN